jgi:hypothetical protein
MRRAGARCIFRPMTSRFGISGTPAELKTDPRPAKSGTRPGTETARRRLVVDDFRGAGLTVRQIADVTGIPRSAVHRAMRAGVRAEAKKQIAIAVLAEELLGKKLHRGRRARR